MSDAPAPAEEAGSAGQADSFEARAAFLLRLREKGIRDLRVLRAIEAVPRAAFVSPRHATLAFRDIALPAACGESVPDPLFVARIAAGSRLDATMRVLVVGLGSGYTAAVLSHLVAEVVAIDRFRTLVDQATERLAALDRDAVETRWADAFALPDEPPFDRVFVLAAVAPVPPSLWRLVRPGGALLHARPAEPAGADAQDFVMIDRQVEGISRQTIIAPCRLSALRPGLAARL